MTLFDRLTTGCARFVGRPQMLVICVLESLLGGYAYAAGDQTLIAGINLLISVTTLLMLPMLQATQNRDGAALQVKLDELIRSHREARDAVIGIERKDEAAIEAERSC